MPKRSEFIQKKREVVANNGVVVAESVEAAEAGLEIFQNGGNAIDAAVATAFASCTCEPAMASLGGGGAALIHIAETNRTTAIEFEGRLSKSATEEMFVDDLLPLGVDPHPSFGWRGTRNNVGWMGYRSLGIPGQVAGLCEILERFGTMSLDEVIAPAIRICETGYEINESYALMIGSNMQLLQQYPPINKLLLPGGYPPIPASQYDDPTIIVQEELAKTLQKIASGGADAFYRGDIAKDIVADTRPHGSIVTLEDYADYQPKWYEAGLTGSYRGYEVICMPEVFGGIQVLQTYMLLRALTRHLWNTIVPNTCISWPNVSAERGQIASDTWEIPNLKKSLSKDWYQKLTLKRYVKMSILRECLTISNRGNPWQYQGNHQGSDENQGWPRG